MHIIALLLALVIASAAPASADTCKVTTAAPTYTDGDTAPLSCDDAGNLRTASASGGADINVTGINGVAPSVNSGTVNAGTLRVELPTNGTGKVGLNAGSALIGSVGIDQTTPGTTNAVSATNFPATVSVNTGATGASSPRVTVAVDSATVAGSSSLPAGSNQIGGVNVSQINGVTPLMGAGNTGTGSPRVTIATDQAALAAAGQGATAAAAPAGATQMGARSGANMVGVIQGDTTVALTMSTATTTEFIALSGSTKIYITAIDFVSAGTTNVTLKYGTGSNCGTGTTSISGVYTLTAQAGIAKGGGLGPVIVIPAGQAFCVTNSAAVVIGGTITYTQF